MRPLERTGTKPQKQNGSLLEAGVGKPVRLVPSSDILNLNSLKVGCKRAGAGSSGSAFPTMQVLLRSEKGPRSSLLTFEWTLGQF